MSDAWPTGLSDLAGLTKRGDLGLAFGVIGILIVLILPMPAGMLDMLLAISITFSVLILMTALFHTHATRILRLPHRAPDRHHVAAGVESRLDASDPDLWA